jgi:hypothetical protein
VSILFSAEQSVPAIVHDLTAAWHIGRDQWFRHGSTFKQRSWRAFAVRRQHDAVRLCDMRANIISGTEELDYTFANPAIDNLPRDSSTVFDIKESEQGACDFRPLCLQDPRSLDVLANTFVIKQAGNEQKARAFRWLLLGCSYRLEMLSVDPRTRQQSSALRVDKCVLHKQFPVIVVLEKYCIRARER